MPAPVENTIFYPDAKTNQAAKTGYTNRHKAQAEDKIKEQQIQMVVEKKDESKKKTYTLDFMLSLRNDNKDRPVNMALLDFPHKRRKADFRKQPLSEIDKFNQSVGQIRI